MAASSIPAATIKKYEAPSPGASPETMVERVSDDGHGTGLSVGGLAKAIARFEAEEKVADDIFASNPVKTILSEVPIDETLRVATRPSVAKSSTVDLPPPPQSPPPKFTLASPKRKRFTPFSYMSRLQDEAFKEGESPPKGDDDEESRRTHPSENIRSLLAEYRGKFKISAAAHNMTSTHYNTTHQAFTITIMVISIIGTVLDNLFNKFDVKYGTIINNILYVISAVLAGVSSGQNFGKLAEKHAQLRDEYISMIASIDGVLAVDADLEAGRGFVDFGEVLKRIEEMRSNIKKGSVQIPAWVQERLSKSGFWETKNPPPEVLAAELF